MWSAANRGLQDQYMSEAQSSFECYKKSPYLSIKYSSYFPVYDMLFGPWRGKPVTFMEIGVLNGGSLFMWREFFGPQARIIGLDLNPGAKKWEAEGFEIFIGSQSDPEFWKSVMAQVGEVDLVLDDGGHSYEQQIVTVEGVLPYVREGGLLVVEDTHTSYMADFGGPSRYSFVEYAKNITNGINNRYEQFTDKPAERVIHNVQFFESIIAFKISRKLAGASCELLSNDGISSDAADYRHADNKVLSGIKALGDDRIRYIKNLPLIGVLAIKLSRAVKYFTSSRTNAKLRQFFRY
jgi:cephalosporin hydroxylase